MVSKIIYKLTHKLVFSIILELVRHLLLFHNNKFEVILLPIKLGSALGGMEGGVYYGAV